MTLDFWTSHRLLSNVATDNAVEWDKTVIESSGRSARCHFTPEEGKDTLFTITEDSPLPDEELNPPKREPFQPEPYSVPNADLLLLTSPTGVFNKHKHTSPENYLTIGKSELKLMDKVTHSVSLLDMDLPVPPRTSPMGFWTPKETKR